MSADPVGDVFDERRAEIAARPLDRPSRDGVNREIIIAVDPERRNAEAEAARRESAGAAPRDALEGRDRPLIIDDVEHHRRLVGGGEDKRGVEIGFGGRPIADPSRRDPRVVLDGRSHGPADSLDELRGEISRDREEAERLRGVENRHLPALQRVLLVGKDLAHHVDERIAGRDQEARLPIGREVHVARLERLAKGAAHGFLAHMLHVEGCLALPLRHQHARIEAAQGHHMAQALEQLLVGQETGPGADRLALPVEHADDREGEVADRFRIDIDLRPRNRAGARNIDAREIGFAAGPNRRFRHMQAEGRMVVHSSRTPVRLPRSRQSCDEESYAKALRSGNIIGSNESIAISSPWACAAGQARPAAIRDVAR